MKKSIIFSISSDIGYNLSLKLLEENHTIYGTYNTYSDNVKKLKELGVKLFKCNLLEDNEISETINLIKQYCSHWDNLFILQASMNPIGLLEKTNMIDWEKSIKLNFINQIKIIKELLDTRNLEITPSVITFAGGGTNNATKNFSAYTISKISLIKMMELLYAEYSNVKFTCIGPGWVKTKIHEETIQAKNNALEAYNETVKHLDADDFTKMDEVIKCLLWIIKSKKEIVSGRNFSVTHDKWGTKELEKELEKNSNMYKLRREGNQWK